MSLLQLVRAGTWVQGALHVVDFQQQHYQLVGEPYTYINLLSYERWQLNALYVACSLQASTAFAMPRP